MKRAGIALLIATLFPIPNVLAATFTDVPETHLNYVAISHLNESGVIGGYDDGSFKPDKTLNRAEALKVILTVAGVNIPEEIPEAPFTDTPIDQWYIPYVYEAKQLGIINGNPDGTFAPGQTMKRAEFFKMLLETNRFKKDKWANQNLYGDVAGDAWYAAYLNYAGQAGLALPDKSNNLYPEKLVTRAEMVDAIYLLKIILNGNNTQLLLEESEDHMAQIEKYVSVQNVSAAKRASELAFDMTQKALQNMPDDAIVLGAAKIAKAYDLLVDAYIAGIQDDKESSRELAEMTKVKATEGWEANNELQPIAAHIKSRADEILSQL